jgi:hypothetical protein
MIRRIIHAKQQLARFIVGIHLRGLFLDALLKEIKFMTIK